MQRDVIVSTGGRDGSARRIGSRELEQQLERIRASAAGERSGLFGPGSVIWRVDREAALFLGAGRALLLQLAHPWVAAGIAQHSATLTDPIGRFHRTFAIMFTLVFGSLDQARSAARRLHGRHQRIQGLLPACAGGFEAGTGYSANEASALMWVHATLIDTALMAHDLVLPPLAMAEREQYYQECRRLGGLFGLTLEDQPATWTEFSAYFSVTARSDAIAVTPEARLIAKQVLSGAGSGLRSPGWYRAVTAGVLPQHLRRAYGLPYGAQERRTAERALRSLKRLYPALPQRLRFVGPYQEAMGRISGEAKPRLAVRGLNRLWIGRASMASD